MDSLTAAVGILAALSVSVERIVEIIKTIPGLSSLLVKRELADNATDEQREQYRKKNNTRKMWHHLISIVIGTVIAYLSFDAIVKMAPNLGTSIRTAFTPGSPENAVPNGVQLWLSLLVGLLASGGSSFWNSGLGILNEIKNFKEKTSQQKPV